MAFKPCRYGCGVYIELQEIKPGVWRPFQENGLPHKCRMGMGGG